MQENSSIREIREISKFITSKPVRQTITIHIMPNISRNKGSQTMKFGQLTYYNVRNIFLEKQYTKCGGKTILRCFSKKSKFSICQDQQLKVLYSLFLCMPSWQLFKNIKTKLQIICFYIIKAFIFLKKRSGTSLHDEKYILHYIPLTNQVSFSGTLGDIEQYEYWYLYVSEEIIKKILLSLDTSKVAGNFSKISEGQWRSIGSSLQKYNKFINKTINPPRRVYNC